MIEHDKIREILQKRLLNRELTASEELDLEVWLLEPANKAFFEDHIKNRKILEVAGQVLDLNEPRLDRKMREALQPKAQERSDRRPMVWLAAASVTLLIGGIVWWQTKSPKGEKGQVAVSKPILPATNRARLKLANDSIVYLDSTRNGQIATQGKVSITKVGAELAYTPPAEASNQPAAINELTVPRAGQFQLKLPDGTHVWLNSATTISYPVAFGKERRIRINGEAFLDVAKDPSRPFIVETPGSTTQVLGTTFDVNAYADDSSEMITVISGAVSVEASNKQLKLAPGDQAFLREDNLALHRPNLQAVTAWRRGFFYFQNADVHSIMHQIARFYDVTVQYNGTPSTEGYDGLISRDLKLDDAVKLLKLMNINVVLTEKTITVSPAKAQE